MFFPRPSKNLSPITLSLLLAALFAFAGCADDAAESSDLLIVDSDATERDGTVEFSGVSYSVALDMDLLASGASTRIAEVTVTILDSEGATVEGLEVAGSFHGSFDGSASVTGTTDRSGQVIFASPVTGADEWLGFELDGITRFPISNGIETSPGCKVDGIETSPDCQGDGRHIVAPETLNGIETSPVSVDGIETSPKQLEEPISSDGIETSPYNTEIGADGIETSPYNTETSADGIETSPFTVDGIETSP